GRFSPLMMRTTTISGRPAAAFHVKRSGGGCLGGGGNLHDPPAGFRSLFVLCLGPGVLEGDAAVEYRVRGIERAGVADEVAEAFELERDAGPGVGERGLELAVGEGFEAGGVE